MSDATTQSLDDPLRRNPAIAGVEFLPPLGKPATAEQTADFWIARGKWQEDEKEPFVRKQHAEESRDPKENLEQRWNHTNSMRLAVRNEIAKDMSAEEIVQRYEAVGHKASAAEFKREHTRLEAGESFKDAATLREHAGKDVLTIEERKARDATEKAVRPQTLKDIMAQAEKEVEQDKQQTNDKGLSPFRAAANEVGGQSR